MIHAEHRAICRTGLSIALAFVLTSASDVAAERTGDPFGNGHLDITDTCP